MTTRWRVFAPVALTLLIVSCQQTQSPAGKTASTAVVDALPSWNDGPSKKAITSFVERVTKEGSPDFVPVAERIATFDNDGTLWSEQPLYFQFLFVLDRVKELAPQHPEWKNKQPYKGVIEGDLKAALAAGEKGLAEMLIVTSTGMTVDEYTAQVTKWIESAKHPKFNRPYTDLVYQPMLELLEYLRANGFKTYIVSGGEIGFMRPWAERVYGIPPEQVVGTALELKYEVTDGKPALRKLPKLDLLDDNVGKPVGIERRIGRRPVFAAGNSDGDFQMLEWTTTAPGARMAIIVHHTDAEREFAYDRESHIGKLDKGLDEAPKRGWVLVDMKQEWNVIYPFQKQ